LVAAKNLAAVVTCANAVAPCRSGRAAEMEGRPVATWTTAHIELTLDRMVVSQPREVIALCVHRRGCDRDLAAVPNDAPAGNRGSA
jgi:hypothetical protein